MKKSLALALLATGGLTASVHAQLEIVNNVSGTWIEISGTGNMLTLGDDQSVQIFNTVSNQLFPAGGYVSSNGSLGSGQYSSFSNGSLPSSSFHGGTGLAPLWDDLNPTLGGMVYWQEIGDTLIVQWQDVPFYASAGEPNTFQVQVFGSGPNYAQFLYQGSMSTSRQRGDGATIGAQQDPGTAVMYSFNQDILTPGTVLTVRTEDPSLLGACCLGISCASMTETSCIGQGGTFMNTGSVCATANCPGYEFVGNLPGIFTDIGSTGTFITDGDDSSQPFMSSVTNALIPDPNLYASTNGVISSQQFGAYGNTELPAVGAGLALLPFWDDLYADPAQNGAVLHQGVVENGVNVHIVQWNNVRTFDGGTGGPTGTFQVKIFESGPVIAQYIYVDVAYPGTINSNGMDATVGFQASSAISNSVQYSYNTPSIQSGTVLSLVQTGGTQPCYANCDGSTVEPVLNVDDFTCFINEFASAQALPHAQQVTHYANCDSSTTAPALNVDDFTCFINEFAAGCR